MYLNKQSYNNLMSQRYTPSEEYMEMRRKLENKPKGVIPKGDFHRILIKASKKLSNLAYAFQVAEKTNRRVLDVYNGRIRLVA